MARGEDDADLLGVRVELKSQTVAPLPRHIVGAHQGYFDKTRVGRAERSLVLAKPLHQRPADAPVPAALPHRDVRNPCVRRLVNCQEGQVALNVTALGPGYQVSTRPFAEHVPDIPGL